MPMYNLIECSDNYSKKSRTLWQYHRDVPAKTIQESNSFKSKIKITGNTYYDNDIKKKVVEIAVPLKYCSDFWKTLEIPLNNIEISIILTWSENCFISPESEKTKFATADTNLYVPVVTLWTEDNVKLLKLVLENNYLEQISI